MSLLAPRRAGARSLAAAVCAGLALLGCSPATTRVAPVTLVFSSPEAPDLAPFAASIVRVRTADGSSVLTRSGAMIDPRGYVLTTFSSIGSSGTRGRTVRPGTLFGGGDDVRVEVFDGPFSTAPTEYIGRVVRGDIRLNLALVRITASVDGPLADDQRFASLDPATDVPLSWGSFGWIVGSVPTVPSLVAFHSNVAAAITNSEGVVAGYVLNSWDTSLEGAPFFDADGRFAGVHVAGFVRPVSRMPAAWRDELAASALDDRRIEGLVALTSGTWAEVAPIGDSVFSTHSEESSSRAEVLEEFVFTVPNAQSGTFTVEPPVTVAAYQRGRSLLSGTGEIYIPGEPDVYVVVRMPRPSDPRGLRLRVRFVSDS